MKKLTDNEIKEILVLYSNGVKPKEIADKFGILNNSVNRILRKNNVEIKHKIDLTEDDKKDIIEKYLSGISSEEIAKKYDIHGTTVCRVVKNAGYEIRGRKGSK